MITQTPSFITESVLSPTRVDFEVNRYEEIIAQKGVDVQIEKSLLCPCKVKSSSNLSNCKNCGGSGWIFATPTITRLIVQSINLNTDYKAWSEELKGTIKVSSSATEELSFMDKLTLLNAESIFSEIIYLDGANQEQNSVTLGYSPKQIICAAKFDSTTTPLTFLTKDIDYTIVNNIFTLISYRDEKDISITLRYKHAPVYYILDFNRENMQTFVLKDKEEISNMPTFAIAKRAHYVLNMQNSTNNRLLLNPWPNQNNCK